MLFPWPWLDRTLYASTPLFSVIHMQGTQLWRDSEAVSKEVEISLGLLQVMPGLGLIY